MGLRDTLLIYLGLQIFLKGQGLMNYDIFLHRNVVHGSDSPDNGKREMGEFYNNIVRTLKFF